MVQDRIYNYFDRNPQLQVLFIFDKMDIIKGELDEVEQWAEGYIYKVFDGSWFNTKYDIENTWIDKKVVLLFTEENYPHTDEQKLKFPLLDMLKANMEYKEDDYASFMQQYGLPERFCPFVKRNIGEMMSTKMRALLDGHIDGESFSEDIVCRAFVSMYLGEKKILDWENIMVKILILCANSDKKQNDFFARLEKNRDARKAVDDRLAKLFGMSYDINNDVKMKSVAECLKYNSITQLLDAVPHDAYKKYKIKNSVVLDQINKIYEIGINDRILSDKFGQALQTLAADIKEEEIIKSYGVDAQYFYMTEALCWPILKKLLETKLTTEPNEVNNKMRELSLKLPLGSDVQHVVKFTEQLALYYNSVQCIGSLKLNTPDDYIRKYINDFYLIDMLYRKSLEAYHKLITKSNPIEETIGKVKKQLDLDYSSITNAINFEWLTCVKDKGKYFNGISLKHQEDFYKNEYDATTKQVIIVSDALRYEVASELMQELAKEKHVATLSAYCAMLPTETKFCKPSLLPHNHLELQGADMTVDGQILATTDQRTSHVAKFKDKAVCIKYENVMNGDIGQMRELFKSPLVYIFHDTIDEASHSQNTFDVMSACRTAVDQLAVLVKRLHATWNVTNVMITADHGFIYNDIIFEDKDKHSIVENAIEKKTRYYLTTSDKHVEGLLKFPLDKVSGISTTTPTIVAVPIGTNRLAGQGGYNFAHGGATLQEMIIPLIKSVRKKVEKTEKVDVAFLNHNLIMVSGQLRFQIIQSNAVSMMVMERKIICCIYDNDDAVTAEKKISLDRTDTNLNNRVYDVAMNLTKSVKSSILQLRIYDEDDMLNPIITETVKNNTLIENDFDF